MAMTLDKARELLKVQLDFGGYYNRNSTRMILADVQREHGQKAADQLIVELEIDKVFDIQPGATINVPGRKKD